MTWELVAMSESGDSYVMRRPTKDLWLVVPEGGVGGGLIDQDELDRAIASHGFKPVGESYEDKRVIERRVNELAQRLDLPQVETTLADVESFLPTLIEDASDPELASQVLDEATEYLRVPGVNACDDLFKTLMEIRDAANKSLEQTKSATAGSGDVHERWQLATAS